MGDINIFYNRVLIQELKLCVMLKKISFSIAFSLAVKGKVGQIFQRIYH